MADDVVSALEVHPAAAADDGLLDTLTWTDWVVFQGPIILDSVAFKASSPHGTI